MSDSITKVLIVDDEDTIRDNLTAYLEDEGYVIVTAPSAEEGLEYASDRTIHVGIVDMRLPGMDGNAFIKLANEKNPDLKFIIHTGSSNYALPGQLRNIGITDEYVFSKPIQDMALIVDAIKRLLP